jgi:phosphoribosylformylglycinamidine synthase
VKAQPEVTEALAREHGLSADEWARLCGLLGRTPSYTELGVASVMWSEHCSYKSSRRFLKGLPTTGPRVVIGPGENAGAVDIGDGQVAIFKMESHNHPSFIEPFQGAATGVGGILRDVFTMGARPIACLNSLRFGKPGTARTRHLVEGVVAGIGFYGNCFGVPTVGGEVIFDEAYDGNILVNAFALGLARKDRIFLGTAAGVGNPVLYVGARTGRDGIHGATMASAEFGEGTEEKRPTVQVGDPFTEKLLLEACLELMERDLVVGIQDMGAAGLTSSSVEMAGRAGNGIELDLDAVPRREQGMLPYEIMLSESQERMLLVAEKGREQEVLEIFGKWDLQAAVVGRVTDTGRLVVKADGAVHADLPIAPLTEGLVYDRPRARPAELDRLQALGQTPVAPPADLGKAALAVLGSPNVASKWWVWRQYDHMVQDGTVVRPGSDAAIVRVFAPDGHAKGIALTVDCNGRFCKLDPYEGARLAIAECARNLSAAGAVPLAVTDCLNFGNPERPEIMWQFEQAVKGIADACRALETPVVSGNVSLYNETAGEAILPTPTVAMIGLIDDLDGRVTQAFARADDEIAVLGRNTSELGGSEYEKIVGGRIAGKPPALDMALELAVQRAARELANRRLVRSAHDCSEGGLWVTLAEACVTGERPLGARVELAAAAGLDDVGLLFGEAPSRIVISYDPARRRDIEAVATQAGAPFEVVGKVGGARVTVARGGRTVVELSVDECARAHRDGFLTAIEVRPEPGR